MRNFSIVAIFAASVGFASIGQAAAAGMGGMGDVSAHMRYDQTDLRRAATRRISTLPQRLPASLSRLFRQVCSALRARRPLADPGDPYTWWRNARRGIEGRRASRVSGAIGPRPVIGGPRIMEASVGPLVRRLRPVGLRPG